VRLKVLLKRRRLLGDILPKDLSLPHSGIKPKTQFPHRDDSQKAGTGNAIGFLLLILLFGLFSFGPNLFAPSNPHDAEASAVKLEGEPASRFPFQRSPDFASGSRPPFLGRGMKSRPATEGTTALGFPDDERGEIEHAAEFGDLQSGQKSSGADVQKKKLNWVLGILAAAILTGFLVRFKLARKFRVIFLLSAVVVLGFYKGGCPCMISSFTETTLGLFGAAKHWSNYLWFLGLIPITYVFGRVWCGWVCHLGALQEFLFLDPKFQALKGRLAQDIMRVLQYLLFATILIQLFITKTNIWCRIDPFLVTFNLYSATTIGFVLLALMLVSSAFICRPFCRAACPVGLILGWVSKIPGASILEKKQECIICSICSESCPLQAIQREVKEESSSLLFKNRDCNACGDCLTLCDKNAIRFARTKIKPAK